MTEEDFKVGVVITGDVVSVYKLPEKLEDYTTVSVITEQLDDNAVTGRMLVGTYRDKLLPDLEENNAEISYYGMDPITTEGE